MAIVPQRKFSLGSVCTSDAAVTLFDDGVAGSDVSVATPCFAFDDFALALFSWDVMIFFANAFD